MTTPPILWTIGHSTRPSEELLMLLTSHDIRRLVDIRTIPRSRHNPQFNGDQLSQTLANAGIHYAHMPSLGGLRRPGKYSPNTGWRNESFRGYADYMQTEEFQKAIEELITCSGGQHTAIMCAEAVPWRCHRSLVADALLVRGWTVKHIFSKAKTDDHHLTSFAVIDRGKLTYPAPADSSTPPRLL